MTSKRHVMSVGTPFSIISIIGREASKYQNVWGLCRRENWREDVILSETISGVIGRLNCT